MPPYERDWFETVNDKPDTEPKKTHVYCEVYHHASHVYLHLYMQPVGWDRVIRNQPPIMATGAGTALLASVLALHVVPGTVCKHLFEFRLGAGHDEGDLVVDWCLGLLGKAADEMGLTALLAIHRCIHR